MATRDIRTSNVETACDVCGRTLLRGERAEVYLAGGERRNVCELCKSRALHEGWIKEGTVPAYDAAGASQHRRRSIFSRLRARAESPAAQPARPTLSDELDGRAWADAGATRETGAARESFSAPSRPRSHVREPRHVRAVPTSMEHKQASAVAVFNASEHPRTVAGVARSLGPPMVSVRPSDVRPSVVNMAVSWELCWYRYEVDLSEDEPIVRLAEQGAELDQLEPDERDPNASSAEDGSLSMVV